MNEFKRYFLKYRLNIASGLTLILAFIAVLSIYFSLEVRVQSNDECLWEPKKVSKDSVEMYFNKVKVNGVSWNAGIRNGYQLLEIDGVKLSGTLQAQEILNKFDSEEYADYVVKKPNGEILKTKVYVKKLIQFDKLAAAISALIFLLIGFIVYSAKPDGLAQRIFYAIGIFTVLAAAVVLFPLDDLFFIKFIAEQPKTALIAGSIVIISQVFVQFFVLILCLVFSCSI